MFEFRDFEEVFKKKNEHTWQRFQMHRKRRTNVYEKVFNAKKKCSCCCYNAYLLRQTSRRVLLAAGFRLNQIVSWFLSVLILYFTWSLKSLPRKFHQQPRTIHHAKIDQRKKPFLLNTSCYRQITLQALVGKHAQYQLNCLLSDFNDMISNLRGYDTSIIISSHGVRAQGTSSSICFLVVNTLWLGTQPTGYKRSRPSLIDSQIWLCNSSADSC